jgi:hypothetical protein
MTKGFTNHHIMYLRHIVGLLNVISTNILSLRDEFVARYRSQTKLFKL